MQRMVDLELKCSTCGTAFEVEHDDNTDGPVYIGDGYHATCPKCGSDGSDEDITVEAIY